MNAPAKASSFTRAARQGVGAIVGIAGISGAGKTVSALRLARGMAADPGDDLNDPETLARVDARIAFIDSERGRALHYAIAPGQLPTPWVKSKGASFGFFHAPIVAPFTPDNYKQLIAEADEALDENGKPRFRVIIVDSGSHEWDGEGGCHDMHDDEAERMVSAARRRAVGDRGDVPSWWNDEEQLEKVNLAAWKNPKKQHKRFVGRLLQCQAHLVFCMRAEDKMRIETKKEQGRGGKEYTKTQITAPKDMPPKERWQPVCEKRLPYELLTSLVLTPDKPGVPIILKAEEAHRALINEDGFVDEALGVALARWASGASDDQLRPNSQAAQLKPVPAEKKAAPPASDAFPGDPVKLAGALFDPAKPKRLAPVAIDELSNSEVQAVGKAMRELIERAPAKRDEWLKVNAADLEAIKQRSAKLHDFIVAPLQSESA